MVAVPHTYAEWVNVLEQLKEGMKDEEVVAAMQQGTLEWQSGVSERFSQRLVDTVNFRLKRADDKFQKIYSRSGGQETGIAQALLSLRKELSLMKKMFEIPAIPEEVRTQYCQMVVEQANDKQKALEDSAKLDRTGRLLNIIRNNRVNAI